MVVGPTGGRVLLIRGKLSRDRRVLCQIPRRNMAVPFPELDPYGTLNVKTDATLQEIKRSYRKLCLLHHPDKLQGKSDEVQREARILFEKVQFAHVILTDDTKRKKYDDTGSLEEIEDSGFDWKEYFSERVEITAETIERDKQQYQGSSDEEGDIIEAWEESNGDFLALFESIPHTEVTKRDETRLYALVEKLISDKVIESTETWETYKKKRVTQFKGFARAQRDESKEADELKAEIVGKRKLDTEDDLRQLIQSRKKQSMDDMISRLESKYVKGKAKKSKKSEYDMDDAAFEKARSKLKRSG